MLRIRIKIKSEDKTFTTIQYVPENYSICKENTKFQELVEKACRESTFDPIDEVRISVTFEW